MDARPPRVNRTPCTVRRVRWSLPEMPCERCQHPARRVWEACRAAVDVDLDRPVLLLVVVSVHECRRCGRHFRARPPFLRPGATYTNRVVDKAVASVYEDGMAVTRVARRLARDFWVRPSEGMIRRWCREHARGLDFEGQYQQWVVEEFSGVLCVDEVYQGQLALLVAVDPAAEDGDRLVGYQLVHGAVEQRDVERFLGRLRAAGIRPEQVITDGSALYPAVLAAVWPTAVHQLCLFHETRPVTKAALQVAKDVRAELPEPPRIQRRRGRPRRRPPSGQEPPGCGEGTDRRACVAEVHDLKRGGLSIRGIVRRTGHSRNTVRRWLREEPLAAPTVPVGGLSSACGAPPAPGPPAPPPPWGDWDQLRRFRQGLADHRFLLVRRAEHLSDAERDDLRALLEAPGGAALRAARAFVGDWYGIWWDAAGRPRCPAEARQRYQTWRLNPTYRALAPLKAAQDRVDEERFTKLSHFLARPTWEATNNGAERMGRQFRHRQAPHFRLRTETAIDDDLRAWALHRKTRSNQGEDQAGRSTRGRKPCRRWAARTAA